MPHALALAVTLATSEPVISGEFPSIDGGTYSLDDWQGKPVLVVNTASLCGFTPQYVGLQLLYDRYRDRGLVVLAVPSGDFRQEHGSNEEVKEFCEVNFDLDLPMTEITPVKGDDAHPFFALVKEAYGFEPNWNFNKILISPDGEVVGTWRANTRPTAPAIRDAIAPFLTRD